MPPIDLQPTASKVAALLQVVSDHQLGGPTPCPAWSVADLADHLGGVAVAFTAAAHKHRLPGPGGGHGDLGRLEPGWRERIARDLARLAPATVLGG